MGLSFSLLENLICVSESEGVLITLQKEVHRGTSGHLHH